MPRYSGRGRPIVTTVEDLVYVAPEAFRRGIGRALLDALITAATSAASGR